MTSRAGAFPYPTEGAETPERVREGKVRLRRYLRRLGFQRVGRTDIYGLSTRRITPRFEDILQRDGPGQAGKE